MSAIRRLVTVIATMLLALAASGSARSQENVNALVQVVSSSSIPHASGPAKIDGILDDAIWTQALIVDIHVETNPRENQPAVVQTTAYLVEDGARLLIAFDARDPDPEAIRAYLRDRDTAYNDDFVGVVLDTFNDQRRAFEFFANPLGVQMDLIQDDVNKTEDDSWDAIWDSAGTINELGFVVEMAIPFSQLRFSRTEGEHTWGIDVLRFRPREDRVRMSNNPLERGRNCYVCQFAKFRGFANAGSGKALEVVPTLTSARTDRRVDPVSGALVNGDFDTELGVSVRWGITPDLTGDLALNPDFSQVEADIPQLAENTQFALLYPETRPFFLEGADYFASPLQAIFTRTVADPDVGAELTGRSSSNTFGVVAAEDAVTNLLFPGPLGSRTDFLEQSNRSFVGRYSRGFGDASTIGALVTRRSGDGYQNNVAGIDGRYRITDQHNIRFQYLDSATEYPADIATEFAQPEGDFGGDALRVNYEFNSRAWYAEVDHRAIEPGFRADSGFITRADFEQHNIELNRIWHGGESNWWNQFRVGSNWSDTQDRTGQFLARLFEPFFSFQGPLQSFVQIGGGPSKQFWEGQIFDMDSVFMFSQIRPRSGLNITLRVRKGEQIDYANARLGDQLRLQPQIDWNVTRHLLVRLRHTSDRLTSKSGPTIFDAELTDLRLTWQFNLRSFLRLTLQHHVVERNLELYRLQSTDPSSSTLSSQLLYSYKLNPQTVFFGGYSDNRLEDAAVGSMTKTDRTLFFKLGYAWTP